MTVATKPETKEAFTIPPDLDVPDDLQDLFRRMRDRLARPRGWCRFISTRARADGTIAYCLVGAVTHDADDARQNERARRVLRSVVGDPVRWNDRFTRKQSHVIALLDELSTK